MIDSNRRDTLVAKTPATPTWRGGVPNRSRFGQSRGLVRIIVLLVLVGAFAIPGDVAAGTREQQIATTTAAQPDDLVDTTSLQGEAGSNSIAIYTMLCPAGTDASGASSFDQMMSACSAAGMPPFPVRFSVNGAAFGSVAPDDRGIALRSGLPPGTITAHIERTYPYKTPVAFCQAQIDGKPDRPLARYPVTEAWSVSIDDLSWGQSAQCFWFYIAPSPGYLYIHTFECPVGANLTSAGPTELKQACPPSRTPVEFILLHETAGVSHELTTADSPEVMFRYLDAGDMTIREAVPLGFGVPIVYCETSLRTNEGTVTVRQYDRQVMTSVDSIQASIDTVGSSITCDWFNVPGALPAGTDGGPPRDAPLITPDEPATSPSPTITAGPTSPPAEPTASPTEAPPTVPGGNDVDLPVENEQPPDPTPTPHIIT